MNEPDLRAELAHVAASLRRHLDRERADGALDLHLSAACRASGTPLRQEATDTLAGVVREGAADPSLEFASAPSRAASAAPSSAASALPSRAASAAPSRAASATPSSAASAPPSRVASAAPATAATSTAFPDTGALSTAFELPPVHPPLHTIDPDERRAIDAASRGELVQIAQQVRACTQCGLCQTRTQAVPGVGSAASGIVFVGEAPGADEDRQGEPFVGRAGQLLTQIIQAMNDRRLIPGVQLDRSTVYIANVLKCRPPENRNPLPHEIESCAPYLRRQLAALQPRIICCLGKFAAELLVGVKGTIGGLRGKVYRYQGAKLIVTYHPAACLRNPAYKRPVWEDMQLLAREYLASGVR